MQRLTYSELPPPVQFVWPGVNPIDLMLQHEARSARRKGAEQDTGGLHHHGRDILDLRRAAPQSDHAMILHQDDARRLTIAIEVSIQQLLHLTGQGDARVDVGH